MLEGFTKILAQEDADRDNKKFMFEAVDAANVAPVVKNLCLLTTDDGLAPSEKEDLIDELKDIEITSGMNKDQQKQLIYDTVVSKEQEKIEQEGGSSICF